MIKHSEKNRISIMIAFFMLLAHVLCLSLVSSHGVALTTEENDGDAVLILESNPEPMSNPEADLENLYDEAYMLDSPKLAGQRNGSLSTTALEMEMGTQAETAAVTVGGFSLYTVEFTYGEKEYVLQGGAEIRLSELLSGLGLEGEVESWEISNRKLFDIFWGGHSGIVYECSEFGSIPTNEGTIPWLLSLQAFHTTEWLKVVIGEIEHKIVVTDDDTSNTVPSNYTSTVSTYLNNTGAITNDSYYNNAEKPANVRQSLSDTSCTDFAAGLPLSTIFIDSSKVGGNGAGQTGIEGKYTLLSKDTAIRAGLVRNGNQVSYDTSKAGALAAQSGELLELNGPLFSFVFEDAAILQDGSTADLKITYSNAKIVVDQRLGVANSTYQGQIRLATGASFSYGGTDSRNLSNAGAFTQAQIDDMESAVNETVDDYGTSFSSSSIKNPMTGHTMDANYQIVDKLGNPINGTFIFAMAGVNLDRDPYTDGSNNYGKPLWYINDLDWGPDYHFFSEAVSINGGMLSDYIYVRPNSAIQEQNGKPNTAYYFPQVIKDANGNVKFIGNVHNPSSPKSGNDETYSSGFVLIGDASTGLKITATGHGGTGNAGMNTQLFSAKQIWYRYTSSTGPNGNIQTTSEGNHGGNLSDTSDKGVKSLILNPNTYVVPEGKTVTYTMTPNDHYQIAKLEVKNRNGVMQEINYNGKPLSTMNEGDIVEFLDAAGQRCTLTALADHKFKLVMPYAKNNEAVHVEWERQMGEVIVRKETVDDKPGNFSFRIKAQKNENITIYNPVELGSIWLDSENNEYRCAFEDAWSSAYDNDHIADLVSQITLMERVEISGGNYLWKTDKKLSDLGISNVNVADDDLFIDFLNAPSAAIGDTLRKALEEGFGSNPVPERIYFWCPHTHVENVTTYWDFENEKGQETMPVPEWYEFTLLNKQEKKLSIEQKYWYEVYEQTAAGWELLSIDGAAGASRAAGFLSEQTGTTPEHFFLNRKLPSLIVEKTTEKKAPGIFTYTVKFTAKAVEAQTCTVTGTATVEDGVAYYSFENTSETFAVDGVIIPAGTFTYGMSTYLDTKCDELLALFSGSSDETKKIKLGTEDGTVSTDAVSSLQSWVAAQSEDGTYTVTYTFASPARGAQPYELPTVPANAAYDSINQQYTFTVASGTRNIFPYLPVGVSYEVIEAPSPNWELVSTNNASGTLENSDNVTVNFTNQRFLDLTVAKTVAGNLGSRDKFFKITVAIAKVPSFTILTLDINSDVQSLGGAVKAPIRTDATMYSEGLMGPENSRDDVPGEYYKDSLDASYTWRYGMYTYEYDGAEYTVFDMEGNPVGTVAAPPDDAVWGMPGQQIQCDFYGEAIVTLYLQHGNSFTLKGIPYGASYTVTEAPEDYLPILEFSRDSDVKTGEETDSEALMPVGIGVTSVMDSYFTADTALTFTNTLDNPVPTGIVDSAAPALAGMWAALALFILLHLGRRQKQIE